MPVIHSSQSKVIEEQIAALNSAAKQQKAVEPFLDPIREFHRASQLEGTARNWLTLSIEQRKRIMEDRVFFLPKKDNEQEHDYKNRCLEDWRFLCVVIQEESRAPAGNQSPEVAIAALKRLFPNHPWGQKKA